MVNKKTKDTPNGCPFYLATCNYNKKDSPEHRGTVLCASAP